MYLYLLSLFLMLRNTYEFRILFSNSKSTPVFQFEKIVLFFHIRICNFKTGYRVIYFQVCPINNYFFTFLVEDHDENIVFSLNFTYLVLDFFYQEFYTNCIEFFQTCSVY